MSDLSREAHTLATVVQTQLSGHERTCSERYSRIASDMAEIKQSIVSLNNSLDSAVSRIHEKREEAAEQIAKAMIVITSSVVSVKGDVDKIEPRIKLWAFSGIGMIAFGILSWAADHFMGGKH